MSSRWGAAASSWSRSMSAPSEVRADCCSENGRSVYGSSWLSCADACALERYESWCGWRSTSAQTRAEEGRSARSWRLQRTRHLWLWAWSSLMTRAFRGVSFATSRVECCVRRTKGLSHLNRRPGARSAVWSARIPPVDVDRVVRVPHGRRRCHARREPGARPASVPGRLNGGRVMPGRRCGGPLPLLRGRARCRTSRSRQCRVGAPWRGGSRRRCAAAHACPLRAGPRA